MKQMFDEAAVGVTDESTVVKAIESPDVAYLQVEVENSGAKDLTAFDVQFKDHPTGEFYTVLSGADYAAGAKAALVFMSADPSSLVAAGKAHLHLWIGSSVAVRFKANCTTAESTTLNIKATGAPNGASARSSGAGSISGFATSAKQDTLAGVVATAAKQDTLLAATQTAILALSDPIELSATTTLATLLGGALNANLKVLTIIPSDSTKVINWAISKVATAGTAVWPPGASASIRINKTQADLLQFFAAVAVDVTILQEG